MKENVLLEIFHLKLETALKMYIDVTRYLLKAYISQRPPKYLFHRSIINNYINKPQQLESSFSTNYILVLCIHFSPRASMFAMKRFTTTIYIFALVSNCIVAITILVSHYTANEISESSM